MKSYLLYTKREKRGAIDALNLFFGALLGANLGTLGDLEFDDYVILVFLLASTVTFLRLMSTSERRGFVLVMLTGYLLLLGAVLTLPAFKLEGISDGNLHRLVATVAIWVLFTLVTEFSPNIEHKRKPVPAEDDQA